MPKSANTTRRPALRRNQACRSCRKRKLKCDAARPHCGTCVKQWQALISVPAPVGYAHPTEPLCSYDPVEGLSPTLDTEPLEKIKQLEDEISQLKSRLRESQAASLCAVSPDSSEEMHEPSLASSKPYSSQGNTTEISVPHAPLLMLDATYDSGTYDRTTVSGPRISLIEPEVDNFMELLFLGWNPDLPDPGTLNHFIDIFFRCDPCGSRILHRTSFLASMHLSPRDPGFPHAAILHAICASASRWSSNSLAILPNGKRCDRFAEFHANKTRQYIDRTIASGENIFSVMQACILLSWYFYQEGRWVEVWIFAGFQTRVAIPLRLNYPGTFSSQGNDSSGAYLPPPKSLLELELRRRTWWMTILFDRIASVGGWIHAVDERDIGTEFPLRIEDFEIEAIIPNNPQNLTSAYMFTSHPPRYTDSFILLIKAVMLFGRVTDFNVRGNLRVSTTLGKNRSPFLLEEFRQLDQLVSSDFLHSLPSIFKSNNGVTNVLNGYKLDTDLYMVHIIPHAATITLHNPYIDFTDPQNVSATRCVQAARSILEACTILSATSIDISRLHPFVTICWYLAAVVQIQLCHHLIEIGDTDRESMVWGEINALRFAMMEYGRRSPIGIRQERLLQGLMREIVRMTVQEQPLEVGLPLYPFSHTTLFGKDEVSQPEPQSAAVPLPSSEFDGG